MTKANDRIRIIATELLNQAIVNLTEYDVEVRLSRNSHYDAILLHVTDGQYHVEYRLSMVVVMTTCNYYDEIERAIQYCAEKMREAQPSKAFCGLDSSTGNG